MMKRQLQQNIFAAGLGLLIFGLGVSPAGAGADQAETFQAGVAAYQEGRLDDAVRLLERSVEMDPNFAPAYNYLGLVHQGLNAPISDIIWLYNVAIEIDPGYADAYLNRCRAYSQDNQPDEAVASCLAALEINPALGSAEFSLAWVYLMGKADPKKAIMYFERVRERGVEHPMLYQGLGMAYAMDGDRGKVLEIVTKLRELGDEERAHNLETAMRNSAGAQGLPAAPPSAPGEASPGQLVPSRPRPDVAAAPASPPVNGMMRVRLRGSLTNTAAAVPSAADEDNAPRNDGRHPGSLSVEPGAEGNVGGESAVDRIRRLQRLRSTVPVQVTVGQP